MNIVVPMKFVPDLVDELEIDESTGLLDRTFLRLVPSELDEHALEQAILLKERHSASVTVVALDSGDVDETLYTAVAKGADRVIKVVGDGLDEGVDSRRSAEAFESVLRALPWDVVLTGTQAIDDLDGSVGPALAARLDAPYVGYVTRVEARDGSLLVAKEYPGALLARIGVRTPAVIGVQAAERAPRYVVTHLVMEAMKSATIEEHDLESTTGDGPALRARLSAPESGSRAQMLEGDAEEVARALVEILRGQEHVA